MSAQAGPPLATEKPIESWKAIAAEVELTVATAWRLARRNRDPLPVWSYVSRVIAWPSALRDWRSRNMLPIPVSEAMTAIDLRARPGKNETTETNPDDPGKNKLRR